MNRKIHVFLLIMIFLTFIASIPNVVTKIQTESNNEKVEIIVNYKSIYSSESESGETIEEDMIQNLKMAGVSSIGLNENSLKELEFRQLIGVYSGARLRSQIGLSTENVNMEIQKNNTYIVIPEHEKQKDVLQTIRKSKLGNTHVFLGSEKYIVEIEQTYNQIYEKPLLYLESDLEHLSYHFFIIPRISNDWGERISLLTAQLNDWNIKKPLSFVLFEGEEVVGYKNETTMTNEPIKKLGVGVIEVFDAKFKQKGIDEYAKDTNYDTVRTHSIPAYKLVTEEENNKKIQRLVIKAIKERNVRAIYINLPPIKVETEASIGEYLTNVQKSVEPIRQALVDEGFEIGQAQPFVEKKKSNINIIGTVASLLGAIYLLFLSIGQLFNAANKKLSNNLFLLMIGSGTMTVITWSFGDTMNTVSMLASLGITILVPVWSSLIVLKVLEDKENKDILKEMTIPIITLFVIGVVYLTSINHGIEFITYIVPFKGVSATLLVPPILVAAIMYAKNKPNVKKILHHKLRVIDVLVFGLLVGLVAFYEMRSGNGGILLPFEAIVRNYLEDVLPVRPRTKEIFFAFPLLIVVVGLWRQNGKIKYLLPLVTIGFSSVMNTFTHFHTPLYISVLRTVFSVTMGFVIGILILTILKIIFNFYISDAKTKENKLP